MNMPEVVNMPRIKLAGCAALAMSASCATAAYTIGADARPRVVNNKIVTDAFDDVTGMIVNDVRYFGYRFQTNPDDPYFTQNPGFNAAAGSGLPPSSTLGFDVVRHLSYWSGSGAVSFTTPPDSESLQFNFGAANAVVTGGTDQVPGFAIASVAADGSMHRHLNALLHGADAGSNPTNGIYFTNIRLRSSDSGIGRSDSLYIVYNNGAQPEQFTAALSYLNNPFAGDANFDGRVNVLDFGILATNFGRSDRFWYDGDFNGDHIVNVFDFSVLASHFGQTAPAPLLMGVSDVPEPAVVVVLGCAVAGWTSLRRRRN